MIARDNFSYAGPLYQQVYHIIRSRILSGNWDSLRPLPGEADLARELRVSIGTVRKAMDQLARDHMVVRERGRGTFIRSVDQLQVPKKFTFFNLRNEQIQPEIVLIDARVAGASSDQAAALLLEQQTSARPSVFEIVREWLWEGQLVCRESIAVDPARFPGLPRVIAANAETLHASYADFYRVKVDGLIWSLGSFGGGGDDCEQRDRNICVVSRLAIDSRSAPIEYCERQIMLSACRVRFGMAEC